jgi:hypothetical protein
MRPPLGRCPGVSGPYGLSVDRPPSQRTEYLADGLGQRTQAIVRTVAGTVRAPRRPVSPARRSGAPSARHPGAPARRAAAVQWREPLPKTPQRLANTIDRPTLLDSRRPTALPPPRSVSSRPALLESRQPTALPPRQTVSSRPTPLDRRLTTAGGQQGRLNAQRDPSTVRRPRYAATRWPPGPGRLVGRSMLMSGKRSSAGCDLRMRGMFTSGRASVVSVERDIGAWLHVEPRPFTTDVRNDEIGY